MQRAKQILGTPKIILETIAAKYGHKLMWNIPYHPELMPIELMWNITKHHVAMADPSARDNMPDLIQEGMKLCTPELWQKAIKKVENFIERYWANDICEDAHTLLTTSVMEEWEDEDDVSVSDDE